jgi:mannosyltransferase
MVALVIVTIVGALLRFSLAAESLWLDELHTAWVAQGGFGDVAWRSAIGNQTPLYFWLIWALTRLVDPNEVVLRLPSLVAGGLLPVAVFWVTARWTGRVWLGVLAAVLAAFDPESIFYATEARPYAVVVLLAIVHVALVADLPRQPTIARRAGVVAGAAILFHLQPTSALLLAAELAYLGGTLVRDARTPLPKDGRRYSARDLGIDAGIAALAILPAVPLLAEIFSRRGNWTGFIAQVSVLRVVDVPWGPFIALLWIGSVAVRRIRKAPPIHAPGRDGEARIAVTLCWLLGPPLLAWLLTATDIARLFFPRYLLSSTPAAFVLIALLLARIGAPRVRTAIGIALALIAIVESRAFAPGFEASLAKPDDWRTPIATLNREWPSARYPVLIKSHLIECASVERSLDRRLREYCVLPVLSLYRGPAGATLIPVGDQANEVLAQALRTNAAAWVFDRASLKLIRAPDSTSATTGGR